LYFRFQVARRTDPAAVDSGFYAPPAAKFAWSAARDHYLRQIRRRLISWRERAKLAVQALVYSGPASVIPNHENSLRPLFWIRRFTLAMTAFFAILFAVYLAKGQAPRPAALDALFWSALSSALFVGARMYHLSKGRACAVCNDGPAASS